MHGRFRFICRLHKGDGHKLFFDNHAGLYAIADNSGDRPDETDDGVLHIDVSRPMRVGAMGMISGKGNEVVASFPVISERSGGEYKVLTTLGGAATLKRNVPGLKVSMTPTADRLKRDLCELMGTVEDKDTPVTR